METSKINGTFNGVKMEFKQYVGWVASKEVVQHKTNNSLLKRFTKTILSFIW